MGLLICVTLHARRFRGRAADPLRTAWPPSPARLIGALLAGAHSLDGADPHHPSGACADAREAIAGLCAAMAPEQPLILTPAPPVELHTSTSWYAPRSMVAADFADRTRAIEHRTLARYADLPRGVTLVSPKPGASSRELKPRTVSLLPDGNQIQYWLDAEPTSAQLAALQQASAAAGDPRRVSLRPNAATPRSFPDPRHARSWAGP